MEAQHPPITDYEAAPDLARPRHTVNAPPETHHTTEDITEETLQPHPALRAWVYAVEGNNAPRLTDTEAMLVNVIVRQQDALSAVVGEWVTARRAAPDPAPAYADEDTAFMAGILPGIIAKVLAEEADAEAAPTTLQRAGFHAVDDEQGRDR